jgi:hypothetical protein
MDGMIVLGATVIVDAMSYRRTLDPYNQNPVAEATDEQARGLLGRNVGCMYGLEGVRVAAGNRGDECDSPRSEGLAPAGSLLRRAVGVGQ